jgi:hypothetical protein
MREMAHIKVLCVLLLSLLLVAFIVPTISSTSLTNLFEEEEGKTFLPVHLLMKQGDELNPRQPTEQDLDMPKSVPNGYVEDYPRIRIGHLEYRTVGTWQSDPLKYRTDVQETIRYSLWCYWEGGSKDVDLRISLLVNNIALNTTTQEILGAGFEDIPKEISLEFEARNFTLQTGDVLSLMIEGKVNGNGGKIMFNGPNYRSGVFLTCNSLRIRSAVYNKELNEIRVQITDAFGMSPYLLNPQLFLDDVLYPVEYYTSYSGDTFYVEIVFPLDQWEAYFNGEHTAQIVLSYSPNSQTVERTITFETEEEESTLPFSIRSIVGVVVLVLIILVLIIICFIVIRRRKRRGKKRKRM